MVCSTLALVADSFCNLKSAIQNLKFGLVPIAVRLRACLLLRPHPILPVRPHEPDNPNCQQRADDGIKLVEVLAQTAPVPAQHHAEPGDRKAPKPRPDESVKMNSPAWHAGDSRWQCDEGPNHWQQPRDEHRQVPPTQKEPVGPIEFAAAEQNPAAIFFDERAPAVVADLVCRLLLEKKKHRANSQLNTHRRATNPLTETNDLVNLCTQPP